MAKISCKSPFVQRRPEPAACRLSAHFQNGYSHAQSPCPHARIAGAMWRGYRRAGRHQCAGTEQSSKARDGGAGRARRHVGAEHAARPCARYAHPNTAEMAAQLGVRRSFTREVSVLAIWNAPQSHPARAAFVRAGRGQARHRQAPHRRLRPGMAHRDRKMSTPVRRRGREQDMLKRLADLDGRPCCRAMTR